MNSESEDNYDDDDYEELTHHQTTIDNEKK